MKAKLIIVTTALSSLILSAFLLNPDSFGVCIPYTNSGGSFCSAPLGIPYGVGLLPFSLAFLGLSIVGLAALWKTFWRWVKFSIGYFILATLWFILIENSSYGMGGISFGFGNTGVWAPVLSVLYAVLSLIIMAISELLGRRKKV